MPEHTLSSQDDGSSFCALTLLVLRLLPLLYTPLSCRNAGAELRAIANSLGQLVEQKPDACIAAILLSPYQLYTPRHAINSAILVYLLAQAQALDTPTTESLACAALTMNIGIADLQDKMAQQASPPSTAQRQLIRLHPLLSAALVREMGITDPLWHEILLLHHEEWNGSGYPFQLLQPHISEHAHLLHVADISCAKLMPRSYRRPVPAQQALTQLYNNRDQLIDGRLIALLVRTLGIYPPGEFVELDNGTIAIVVERTENIQAPRVALPTHPAQRIDTDKPPYRIKRPTVPHINARHINLLARFWESSI
ncbi:HD-GYP domain-containing protein [Craterilacuibacter sp.]|uniref:HD-GYP domain-containing protein n=1 Tax=Craterilacuibacter sp. TaxID=2870909 RepID=UPI003F357999